jgi:hypothetical protein
MVVFACGTQVLSKVLFTLELFTLLDLGFFT